MFWMGDTGWGSFLLVWSLVVASIDNFLRPVLIKKGADLPLLLIFAGVIGGMLGFGLIGLFIGPVALAVTYTLFEAWIDDDLTSAPAERQVNLSLIHICGVPLIGGKLAACWEQLAEAGAQGLIAKAEPYASQSGKWILANVGGLGFMLLHFLLFLVFSASLCASGEAGASTVLRLSLIHI